MIISFSFIIYKFLPVDDPLNDNHLTARQIDTNKSRKTGNTLFDSLAVKLKTDTYR